MALACTGVGVLNPAAVSRLFRPSEILKSEKWTFFRNGRPVSGSISISDGVTTEDVAREPFPFIAVFAELLWFTEFELLLEFM
jgi:hypothetical protein